jgi:acetoin utilization protein AcuB
MIIRNWMRKNPVTIHSSALISQAQQLINQHGLRYMAVVDEGVLRGILRRRDLYEAATHITARQNIHEIRYFNERLKVRDLMIRRPSTVQADEAVEVAMKKGAELGVSFFPVMEGDTLVGTVSYEEIFETFSKILGVREDWIGITLRDLEIGPGALGRVADDVDQTGAVIHSIFTLSRENVERKNVIVRLQTDRPAQVVAHLRAKGYQILEVENRARLCQTTQPGAPPLN